MASGTSLVGGDQFNEDGAAVVSIAWSGFDESKAPIPRRDAAHDNSPEAPRAAEAVTHCGSAAS
jgi:hypothetical protein